MSIGHGRSFVKHTLREVCKAAGLRRQGYQHRRVGASRHPNPSQQAPRPHRDDGPDPDGALFITCIQAMRSNRELKATLFRQHLEDLWGDPEEGVPNSVPFTLTYILLGALWKWKFEDLNDTLDYLTREGGPYLFEEREGYYWLTANPEYQGERP